jgi:glycosyltransferase involved in cell wall biosynthesis
VRVLHVIASGRRRGAEIFASDLIGALDRTGVSQRVVVLRDCPDPIEFGAPTTNLGADGKEGPLHAVVGVNASAVLTLRRLIGRWHPDIVQAHGGEPLKHAVAATMAATSPPIVYRRIGAATPEISRGPRRATYGWLMRRAARIVAVADVLRREVVRTFHVPSANVVTIPNGVDLGRLLPARGREETRRALGLSPQSLAMLSVGALVWEKDPIAQVEIAARVVEENPLAVLLMAGEGPLRSQVEDGIRRRGLEGRVLMLGARDDVPDLLAACDLLLFASVSEGMPACVIEAGVSGVPVAAFAVGGIPEVVEDEVTGVLAAPGDVDALAGLAAGLLNDPTRRSAIGSAARAASARFDIRQIGDRYLHLYASLVGTR